MLPGGRGLVRATARRVVLEVEGKWWVALSQPTLRRARKRIKSRCFSKFSRVGATGRRSLRPFCRCNKSFLGLLNHAGTPSNHPRRSRAALLPPSSAGATARHPSLRARRPRIATPARRRQIVHPPSRAHHQSLSRITRPANKTRTHALPLQCSSPSSSTPSPRGPRTHSTPFRPSGS